ncbi:hypothetical protein PS1_001807 [Malus domestica]
MDNSTFQRLRLDFHESTFQRRNNGMVIRNRRANISDSSVKCQKQEQVGNLQQPPFPFATCVCQDHTESPCISHHLFLLRFGLIPRSQITIRPATTQQFTVASKTRKWDQGMVNCYQYTQYQYFSLSIE